MFRPLTLRGRVVTLYPGGGAARRDAPQTRDPGCFICAERIRVPDLRRAMRGLSGTRASLLSILAGDRARLAERPRRRVLGRKAETPGEAPDRAGDDTLPRA